MAIAQDFKLRASHLCSFPESPFCSRKGSFTTNIETTTNVWLFTFSFNLFLERTSEFLVAGGEGKGRVVENPYSDVHLVKHR